MNTVVYYPHFYPKPEWLKVAALCWDKIYTLVTWNQPSPPAEIAGLNQALGDIMESIYVEDLTFNEDVERRFESWVKSRMEKLRSGPWIMDDSPLVDLYAVKATGSRFLELMDKYGVVRYEFIRRIVQIPKWEEDEWKHRGFECVRLIRAPIPGSDHEKYERFRHEAKQKLRDGDIAAAQAAEEEAERIRQRNLIRVIDFDRKVYLPKDVALHFLSICASQAATDGNRDLIAADGMFTDAVFHDYRALRGEISKGILQAYLPQNVNLLETQRIRDIRDKLTVKRLKYQREIQSLCKEFEEVASEGALEKIRDGIRGIATERIEETKKIYRRAKLESVISTLGIALAPPAIVTSIASMLGIGVFAPAGIVAALSSLIAAKFIELDKAKSEKAGSPWSYILEIEKSLR